MQSQFAFSLLAVVFGVCSGDEYIELNHVLDSNSYAWPNPDAANFTHEPISVGYTAGGNWYAAYKFCSSEHLSTHVDAPYHFVERGWKVDEIPIERLFAPVVVISIREKVSKNNIAELTADDILKWTDVNGPLPNNSVVLVSTGWDKRYNDRRAYFGDVSDVTKFAFPGISASAAQTLIGYRASSGIQIVGVGIDSPSIDIAPSKSTASHLEFSAANIYMLENLKDLQKVPVVGAELIVMPMKIRGGSGAPARVVARVPSGNGSGFITCSSILTAACIVLASYLTRT